MFIEIGHACFHFSVKLVAGDDKFVFGHWPLLGWLALLFAKLFLVGCAFLGIEKVIRHRVQVVPGG